MSKAQAAGFPPAVSILFGRRAKEELFDEYLAVQHLDRIKAAVMAGEPATSVTDCEAADADLADLLDEVSTPALWGKTRLVILRDAEEILSPAAADRERLAPFVARMASVASMKNPPGRLVLIARALEIREGAPHTGFEEANKLISTVDAAGGLFPCIPPYERALKAALSKAAAAEGVQLLSSAADALIAIVGTDQMAVQEELKKLITHASDTRRITPEDVEALAATRPEGNVFVLAERILDGDTQGALVILRDLMQTPATRSESFIIGSLAASFRRYLASALEIERGATAREAAARAGVPQFFQKDYIRRLEKWNTAKLIGLLDRALQCDVEVKTGSVADDTSLAAFVIDACAGRFEATELVGRWLYET